MRTFDLDDLHIFTTVARAGGILRAAEQLSRVPSNVTTRIKQLEERTKLQLLRKRGRKVALTEAGQVFLLRAEQLLENAAALEAEITGQIPYTRLRLGSLESAASVKLPPILAQLHQEYPEIKIELRTGTSRSMLEGLEDYSLDAAFVSEPFDTSRYNSLRAFHEKLVLISSTAQTEIRNPAALAACTVIAFPEGCSYRKKLEEWLLQAAVRPARILEFASYHAIVACVAAGAGVALVPESVLDHAAAGQTVRRHAVPAAIARNATHLVWRGDAATGVQSLIQLVRAKV